MNEDARHTFGRYWYKFITDKMNKPLVAVANAFDAPLNILGLIRIVFEVLVLYRSMRKLPEPTKENTTWALCHALIDIRDEFFRHERNKIRAKVERVVFNIIIVKCQYDPYYHKRIAWVLEKLTALLHKNPEWLYQAKWLKSDQWWEA